jgi:leucyl aminopeptidase
MKIEIVKTPFNEAKVPLATLVFANNLQEFPLPELQDDLLVQSYRDIVDCKEFTGESENSCYIHCCTNTKAYRLFLIGLGSSETGQPENFRLAGAKLCQLLKKANIPAIALKFPVIKERHMKEIEDRFYAFVEGFGLRNYEFTRHRAKAEEHVVEQLSFHEENNEYTAIMERGIKRGLIAVECTNLCRDIANEPSNFMTPTNFVQEATKVVEAHPNLTLKYFSDEGIKENNMGLIAGVAQSGSTPPYIIIVRYDCGDPQAKTLGLVGKGISFDSGGISLKKPDGMLFMKRDLTGGATTLAVLKAVAEIKPAFNVVGIIGAAENMPGAQAYKPGDILTSMAGKTVEIITTDAEGRLLLGDLFTYLQRNYVIDCMVDISTLTGATYRTLGGSVSGMVGNNPEFTALIKSCAQNVHEKFWELPLEFEYKSKVKSYFADLKNHSSSPADTIISALFLNEFIENNLPWVHLDIAGAETASGEPKRYYPRGATGVAVRTLIELVHQLQATQKFPDRKIS